MIKTNRGILLIFLLLSAFVATPLHGQILGQGRFSGSLESNSIYYVPDEEIGTLLPQDRIGSNNYLKLEYTNGRLVIGAQYEYYGKALQGYNPALNSKHGKITNKFVTWSDKYYAITVGDIYEQFGNGLVLRTWEDRDLGFNNSLEGIRAFYNFNDYVSLTALWGRPRIGMDYAGTDIRGADLSVCLATIFNIRNTLLDLQGSFVNRYYKRHEYYTSQDYDLPNNTDLMSVRLNYEADFGLLFRSEFAYKTKDVFEDKTSITGDATGYGNAALVELGYNGNGFGILLTGRRLKHMVTILNDGEDFVRFPDANVMNYLPSLTRQFTYMLANLQPYLPSPNGEQAAALDFYYNIKRGTALGGKYGTKLHISGSMFFPVQKNSDGNRDLLWADASVDIEKKWNNRFETTLLYSFQGYHPQTGVGITSKTLYKYNIFVADMLYKFTRKTSLRVELQYLHSKDDFRDWWGALAEVSFAPKWSIFGSDMYNWKGSGYDKNHYYNAGFSFTHQRTRVALSYGRNRAGFICSGGVCRVVPAYTGANLVFTTSF